MKRYEDSSIVIYIHICNNGLIFSLFLDDLAIPIMNSLNTSRIQISIPYSYVFPLPNSYSFFFLSF